MSAREYWTVLREDRKLIAGVLVLCLLGAVLLDLLLPRTYTSSAVFYVASAQQESSSTDAYSGAQFSTERVKSYAELGEPARRRRRVRAARRSADPRAGPVRDLHGLGHRDSRPSP